MVKRIRRTQADSQIDFPGKDPQEEFRFYVRRHWTRVLRYIFFTSGWTALFAVCTWASGVWDMQDVAWRHTLTVLLCTFFLLPHWWCMTKIYKHFLCVVIVTDKKIHRFTRTLLAEDRHVSVDLWVLQDIDKIQRGLIQNLLGFGSLRLEAQNSQLTLHLVPHINETYDRIVALREHARHRLLPGQVRHERTKIANGQSDVEKLPAEESVL